MPERSEGKFEKCDGRTSQLMKTVLIGEGLLRMYTNRQQQRSSGL
jgi:hypothetical protein